MRTSTLRQDLMTMTEPQRLVKSVERVRDLGEVFTPRRTVDEMLDLLPSKAWQVHPSYTFLEPSAGDGNFIVRILQRKLDQISKLSKSGKLPAGESQEAIEFHAIQALASIYAIDISKDNVIGGKPGHEIGARTRMLNIFEMWVNKQTGKKLTDRTRLKRVAIWIVEHNIIVGNMLPLDAFGKATSRNKIPIIEYLFDPSSLSVEINRTTLGDILDEAQLNEGGNLSLFGAAEPIFMWRGKAINLDDAEKVKAPRLVGPARNATARNLL